MLIVARGLTCYRPVRYQQVPLAIVQRMVTVRSIFKELSTASNISLDPVDDLGGDQWWLDNVNIPEVWNPVGDFSGASGAGTVVAVVDTGVDLDHREFQGRIVVDMILLEMILWRMTAMVMALMLRG